IGTPINRSPVIARAISADPRHKAAYRPYLARAARRRTGRGGTVREPVLRGRGPTVSGLEAVTSARKQLERLSRFRPSRERRGPGAGRLRHRQGRPAPARGRTRLRVAAAPRTGRPVGAP